MKFEDMPNLDELECDMKAVSWHLDKVSENCPLTEKPPKSDQLHFVCEPVDLDWKRQNIWILISKKKDSSFYLWTEKFVELNIIPKEDVRKAKDSYELAKFLGDSWVKSKKILHCKKMKIGRSSKPNWFPVSVVD